MSPARATIHARSPAARTGDVRRSTELVSMVIPARWTRAFLVSVARTHHLFARMCHSASLIGAPEVMRMVIPSVSRTFRRIAMTIRRAQPIVVCREQDAYTLTSLASHRTVVIFRSAASDMDRPQFASSETLRRCLISVEFAKETIR